MKTILIVLDGMRPDSIAQIPAARRILQKAAVTLQGQTVFPPVTLPCHMTMFHSVTPQRHGITANTYMPQVRPIRGLFEVLKQAGKKCAAFYDWEALRDISRPGSLAYSCYYAGSTWGYQTSGDKLTRELIRYAQAEAPDFAFLFLGLTDAAGHKYGWMQPEYLEAMAQSWDNVEKIINALGQDYTYIITADHGGHDRTHGADIPEDMRIPLVITAQQCRQLPEGASILDIAPTVAKLLEVAPDEEWEGKALL